MKMVSISSLVSLPKVFYVKPLVRLMKTREEYLRVFLFPFVCSKGFLHLSRFLDTIFLLHFYQYELEQYEFVTIFYHKRIRDLGQNLHVGKKSHIDF